MVRCADAAQAGSSRCVAVRSVSMLKVIGWVVAIIFIIGLLVVTGVLKLIF